MWIYSNLAIFGNVDYLHVFLKSKENFKREKNKISVVFCIAVNIDTKMSNAAQSPLWFSFYKINRYSMKMNDIPSEPSC